MEYLPLLPPGLHDFQQLEVEEKFVRAISGSSTRPFLFDGLVRYFDALRNVGVKFEVWLDGSFSTDKQDPNDIDLVIFGSTSEINSLAADKYSLLKSLIDRHSVKDKYGCDVLFAEAEDVNRRSYWRGWYGFDRNENPKGIAKLVVVP